MLDVTLTLPYSGGGSVSLHGTRDEVHDALAEMYLGSREDNLHAAVLAAIQITTSSSAVAEGLGGKVESMTHTPETEEQGEVEEVSEGTPSVDEQAIVDLFMSAETVAELKGIYAKNKDAFQKYESVRDAYKARGKSLTAKN